MGQDARLARSDAFFRLGIFVPLEFAVLWMGVAASGEAGGIRVLGLRPAWYAVFTSVLAAFLLVDFVMRRPVLQVRTPSRHALVEVGAGGITGLVIGELLWDRFDLGSSPRPSSAPGSRCTYCGMCVDCLGRVPSLALRVWSCCSG